MESCLSSLQHCDKAVKKSPYPTSTRDIGWLLWLHSVSTAQLKRDVQNRNYHPIANEETKVPSLLHTDPGKRKEKMLSFYPLWNLTIVKYEKLNTRGIKWHASIYIRDVEKSVRIPCGRIQHGAACESRFRAAISPVQHRKAGARRM